MNTLCYFNGEYQYYNDIHLHVSDLAITRGYGVFDFLRAKQGVPLFLADYLQRFYDSAAALLLDVPLSYEQLHQLIWELIEKNGGGEWGIRLMLTGGYSTDHYTPEKPNFMVLIVPMHFPEESVYEKGIHLMTYAHQRDLAEAKSLNYLMPIYLRQQLAQAQAHDVLYHYQGVLTESSRSNFFFVKEGKLITPQEQILNGITRRQVILIAEQDPQINLEIRTVHPEELATAEEAFVTSTTKRILPVSQIDGTALPHTPGKVTQLLMQRFADFEAEYLTAHSPTNVR